eukprot:12001575-Ditylum_brightwellii.AAC.3
MDIKVLKKMKMTMASTITVVQNGTIELSTSCFAESSSLLPGTVFIDNTSSLALNNNNIGINNEDDQGICNAMLFAREGLCVEGELCIGDCIDFEAEMCLAADFLFTEAPTVSPSVSLLPLGSPSDMPSMSIVSSDVLSVSPLESVMSLEIPSDLSFVSVSL